MSSSTVVKNGGRPADTTAGELSLLHRGAEADLYLGKWGEEKAVFKIRNPLPYRLSIIDFQIRTQRTVREAEIISEAKRAGVRTPYLYFVDKKNATIIMECVKGEKLKDCAEAFTRQGLHEAFKRVGESIAKLHLAGIIHGDLTTSNMLWNGTHVAIVDFGLSVRSTRLEDRAVDLRLVKETLAGAHAHIFPLAFSSLLDGYRMIAGKSREAETLGKLGEIERRGRYARVE
jgi:Kae1-associated kinase Bud32